MTNSTMGTRIRQSRTRLGLTTRQLATRIGVKSSTLENWESDRSEPRANRLVMLSGILGVPVVWLLNGEAPDVGISAPAFDDAAAIAQKLEAAVAMQRDLAALLLDISANVARLRRDQGPGQEAA
jgi:transcriptional regulator with XRE-family HTH domain